MLLLWNKPCQRITMRNTVHIQANPSFAHHFSLFWSVFRTIVSCFIINAMQSHIPHRMRKIISVFGLRKQSKHEE